MQKSLIQSLIEKGWSEEEINRFLYILYNKSEKTESIKEQIKRLNFKSAILEILFSLSVAGLFILIFSFFNLYLLSIAITTIASVLTSIKINKLLVPRLRTILLTSSLTATIIICLLYSVSFIQGVIIKTKGIKTTPFNAALHTLVAIGVIVFSEMFLQLYNSSRKHPETENLAI